MTEVASITVSSLTVNSLPFHVAFCATILIGFSAEIVTSAVPKSAVPFLTTTALFSMLIDEPSAYGFQVPRTVLPFLSLASTVRARGLSPLST